MPDDDITYWTTERAKLQQQLSELETGVVGKESFPLIRYLMTRINDLDRHIASLEKKRDA